MTNTGKNSEEIWDELWLRFGKRAVTFKLPDSANINGRNRRHAKFIHVPPQPADRMLVFDGHMYLCEIKSTHDDDRFQFKMLRTQQKSAGVRCAATMPDNCTMPNLCPYLVYVHRIPTNQWYCVPYDAIVRQQDAGKQSFNWTEMEQFSWTP